jgi:hypothetical protein
MDPNSQGTNIELSVDVNNLYSEQTFTDMKYANLRKLTPIKIDGSPDDSREIVFIGSTQVMSPYGPIPVHTQIKATDLADACAQFPDAIKQAVQKMMEEAARQEQQQQQQQRMEQSRIITPGR